MYSTDTVTENLNKPFTRQTISAESIQFYDTKYTYTVEPPITDPPTRGQPLYKGH